MGEEVLVDKFEPGGLVKQEREARCTSALGPERFIARALFQGSPNDSLNQGDISLLERVDRLDNILSVMEDKVPSEPSGNSFRSAHGSKRISLAPSSLEKRCKSTESVLEEVEEKGTLVERVSELEKRLTKLQRMISTKSSDTVAYPGLGEVTTSLHTIPSHDQALSHHNGHEHDDIDVEKHEVTPVTSAPLDPSESEQHKDHEQSLHDKVDVEKHEVTPVTSAPLEPSEYEQHHGPPFLYPEKLDISPPKKESSMQMERQQGMVSTESASMEEEDLRARRQQFKKRSQRIKRWLSKQLHIGSSTRQVETQ